MSLLWLQYIISMAIFAPSLQAKKLRAYRFKQNTKDWWVNNQGNKSKQFG